MQTIYKYEIPPAHPLIMPSGAEIIHVGEQETGAAGGRGLFVWARVEANALPVVRKLEVVGTGWLGRNGDDGKHVGTVICKGGLVWHVFDHGEE